MPKTFDPEDYCPVCENRGFTHGACIVCKREPICQVTRIGDDHLVTRETITATITTDKVDLIFGGLKFNPCVWCLAAGKLMARKADHTNWRTWSCVPDIFDMERLRGYAYRADWAQNWDTSDFCFPLLCCDAWDLPIITNTDRKEYGAIYTITTNPAAVRANERDYIQRGKHTSPWYQTLLHYLEQLQLSPSKLPRLDGLLP